MKAIKHYRVTLDETSEPKGFASAAVRGCMCCGSVLSGIGGGGSYLCQDCLDKMHNGEIYDALAYKARDERQLAEFQERLASKEDALCASRLVIDEYEKQLAEAREEVDRYKAGFDTTGQVLADGDLFLVDDVLHSFDVGQTVRVLIMRISELEQQHEAAIPIVCLSRIAELEQALERIIEEADEYYDSPASELVDIAKSALERGI